MANQEQLEILRQGVEIWNKWRKENPEVKVDLSKIELYGAQFVGFDLHRVDLHGSHLRGAHLRGVNLRGANLRGTTLMRANLGEASLNGSNLEEANLYGADLGEANFYGANLSGATLRRANLCGANLGKASLNGANIYGANLFGADLNGANLSGTYLNEADLNGANLGEAVIGHTSFSAIDLSKAKGLESTRHGFPSNLSTNVLQLSKGEIPEVFLRGCGLNDWEIELAKLYKPGLSNQEIIDINYKIFDLRANRAIQISPLFISYSHGDTKFVDKLEPQFIEKGIRFWRDIHDMKTGRMEKQVDYAMRQNPTVILVLSENSIRSDWVEHEATLARKLEKEFGRDVLCPVALDDSWKSAKWPQRLMEQIMEYNILDFSKWKDDGEFGKMFNKMVAGLDMFYKAESQK